jgi:hypothetical protein
VDVVRDHQGLTPGDWVQLMHAALRRKARCDASGEPVVPVSAADLVEEAERYRKASTRLPHTGTYV